MPSSKSTKSSENAGGKSAKGAPKRAPKAAPKTREAGIAQRANEYALGRDKVSFGAPVSSTQVEMYERAIKAVAKKKPLAQFLGFKSREQAVRQLGAVARGTAKASSLPVACREAFKALYDRLTAIHSAEGKVNKTWPRKHAIVLHALLTEKPARKPRAKSPAKPAPEQTPEPAAA